jgi:hypothetical protein
MLTASLGRVRDDFGERVDDGVVSHFSHLTLLS